MRDFRADLHCHTTFSDGTCTPFEIIDKAAKIPLQGLSITDHDTIDAYITAIPYAKGKGIDLLPGVEFSSVHGPESVHILAYGFAIDNPLILEFCQKHQRRRKQRNLLILEKLKQFKMPVTEEEMSQAIPTNIPGLKQTIGRPHIAQAMVNKGYISSVNEAFIKYLGEGKICYAPGPSFTAEETIHIIHKAGGLAIIAHPHLLENTKVIKELLELPFDGLEAYYARMLPHAEKKWVKIAEKRKWLVTGGSDFHGTIKPNLDLGCSWVNEDTFNFIKSHYLKNLSL